MKILLFPCIICIFFSCGKSTTAPKPTNNLFINGKFARFRIIDTSFNLSSGRLIFYNITTEDLFSTTIRLNVGTIDSTTTVVSGQNYNAGALLDTLYFQTATTGLESNLFLSRPHPFTYSLNTGSFDDGALLSGNKFTLIQLNANSIELIFQQATPPVTDAKASYYVRIN